MWDRHEVTRAAGTRVHAAVLGPDGAPTVVCVHGLGCSHRYFLPLARALAPAAQAVAPDLPGFGATPAASPEPLDVRGMSRAFADWLRATGRGGSVFVANSAGCQVVVDLAAHAPELLGPVVLNAPTMDRHARSAPRQLGRLVADIPRERPTLIPVVALDYLTCGPRRLLATFRHTLADPVERKLRHVRTPAVVVRGSRDPIVPRAWAEEVAALLPAGRLVEVPGAGHALNHSAAGALADVVSTVLPEGVPA
ncbi:MAG TPA: alpha/beta hydrolase [Actinophytocola sp.]|nr:alpha/beta hydrolase [Actinophytocola sp.]